MNVTEVSDTIKYSLKQAVKKDASCIMFDAQGKEVHITAAMVHSVCSQLLNRCRHFKKGA